MQIRLFLTFAVLGLLFPLSFHTCVFYQPRERVGHDAPTPLPCEFLKNETSSYISESNCQSQKMWTSSTAVLSDLQSPYSSHLSDSHASVTASSPGLLPAQPGGLCLLLSAAPPPQVTQLLGCVQAVHSLDRSWNGLGDGSWWDVGDESLHLRLRGAVLLRNWLSFLHV